MFVSNRVKYTPVGSEYITGLFTVADSSPPPGALFALISVDEQPIRFTDDGSNPSVSEGTYLANDMEQPFWYAGNVGALKFIQTAPSAQIYIAYYS